MTSTSTETSRVVFPSSIWTLEKQELIPFERFAYNTLRIGTEALARAKLPTALTVTFDANRDRPWLLNASVGAERNAEGDVSGFMISTTALTPPALFGICHHIAQGLFDPDTFHGWQTQPEGFRKVLQEFGQGFGTTVSKLKSSDLPSAIREFLRLLNVDILQIHGAYNYYDIATQFIANHEVAHAFTGQLTQEKRPLLDVDYRAFEIIVDLVAVDWLYNKMIKNTPDNPEYREFRDVIDHSEAIRENTRSVVEGQLIVLLFMCIASAVQNNGEVSLDGGRLHPHSLLRYVLQQVHFLTLVFANQQEHFSDKQQEDISALWNSVLHLFASAGLLTKDSLNALAKPSNFVDVNRAADIIDEFDVAQLHSAKLFLAKLRSPKIDKSKAMSAIDFV